MSTVLPIAPSSKFVAVTKSDTVPVAYGSVAISTKALYIGGAGDVAVKNDAGTSVTFQNVPAGTVLPVNITYFMSTGTSATNVVALF